MSRVLARLVLAGILGTFIWVVIDSGADSVGGADSAGYFAQAKRWRRVALREPLPFPHLPVADAAWLQSPLGFRPAAAGGATVPTYPPGWPLLLATALPAGEVATVRGVPAVFGVLALAAVYALALTWQRPPFALLATAIVASTPPWLFQALQPMSDVPALAAWLTAFAAVRQGARGWRVAGGLAAALAVAVRPNLAPLLLTVAWFAVWRRPAPVSWVRYTAPAVLPGLAVVAAYIAWQWQLYGSPAQSGYGTASELFSVHHVVPNLSRQFNWFSQSHGWPAIVLFTFGTVGAAFERVLPRPIAAAALVVWVMYLWYVPFDNWTYLRFVLLPLVVAALAATALLDDWLARVPSAVQLTVCTTVALLVIASNSSVASRLGVFELHHQEARYRLAASFIRDHAPASAVVLAAQHSGAVTAYTQLPVLRLDLLNGQDVAAIRAHLDALHRPVVVVADDEERPLLAARAEHADVFRMDWPPRAIVGRTARTRVWFLDDRAASLAGTGIATVRIWPDRR